MSACVEPRCQLGLNHDNELIEMRFSPRKGCFQQVKSAVKLSLPACRAKNASILSLKFLDNNKDKKEIEVDLEVPLLLHIQANF